MASATSTLEILVRLRDEASAQMSKLAGVFKTTWQDSVDSSKKLATGLSAAGAGAFAYVSAATLTAARTETLKVAMDAVAKSTGTSIKILEEQERTLKKQGITTQEARGILTSFMQSQLDVARASGIARVAQDLAVISGTNSSEAAKILTQAIASQEPTLLRNFGIVKNLPEIYEAYGKELGLVSEATDKNGKVNQSWARELTDVEKKQAMMNLIMKEGEKVSGAYDAAMGTVGKKLSSLPRHFEEAANAIGQRFLPVLGSLIDGLTNFLKQITPANINQWIEALNRSKDSIIIIASTVIAMLIPAIVSAVAAFGSMAIALAPFAIAGGALAAFVIGIKEGNVVLTAISGAIIALFIPSIISAAVATWGMATAAIATGISIAIAFAPLFISGAVIAGVIAGIIWVVKNWDMLKAKATEIWGAITKYISTACDSIKTTATNIFTSIGEFIKGIWDGIVNNIKGAINGIISMINSMIGAINSIKISVPKVEYWPGKFFGGFDVGFPQIPTIPLLAKGGIVNSPTLAMIGEAGPEAVIPLSRGGYGNQINVYVTGNQISNKMDLRNLADEVGKVIVEKLKRNQLVSI